PSVSAGLPAERVVPFAPAMTWRGARIDAFPTPHGYIAHDSYLVTWHGVRLYFTGDTDSPENLLSMRNLDAAFVTPWLLEAVAARRARLGAGGSLVRLHRHGERVSSWQDPLVPRQGEAFAIETTRND